MPNPSPAATARLDPAARPHADSTTPLRPETPFGPHVLAAVFAGGAVGGLLRVVLAESLHPTGSWPWATLLANVAGSLVIGVLAAGLLAAAPRSAVRWPALGPGFCGGLTTFATFQVETVELLRGGHAWTAAAYAPVSLVLGLGALLVGLRLGGRR